MLALAFALMPGRCGVPASGPTVPHAHGLTSAAAATPQLGLDKAAYDAKMRALAHVADPASGSSSASRPVHRLWPVKTVYPNAGALLPFHRIVAYYGNFYSKSMGILGQHAPQEVVRRLLATSKQWEVADPTTPVIPAIDYIAVSAQAVPGSDHMYRARMPMNQVDKALAMASQVHGLLFLDFQVGHSTLQKELPRYEQYLQLPNVELSIDPEFSMKDGRRPGSRIGTLDAADINWAANYLAQIVRAKKLPPKILVVYRFTHHMVTNCRNITPLPEVQIVMDMDGWGTPKKKVATYKTVIYPDPVQFTGFKLFYKNDLRPPSKGLLPTAEVLNLVPAPSYIQYQ
ncbi:MAG TPA: hypothetical protein V6D05_00340 [Stenomitos sp.]